MITEVAFEEEATYRSSSPDYDGLWKTLIGQLFKEFTQFFIPDLYEHIDFKKSPGFLQQEYFKDILKDKWL